MVNQALSELRPDRGVYLRASAVGFWPPMHADERRLIMRFGCP